MDSLKDSTTGSVINANIQALVQMRRSNLQKRTVESRVADTITTWSGSMKFLYLHFVWFGLWILFNVVPLGVPRFDPFPFGLLTMVVSLEAIFLSTVVMISQNRMAIQTEEKADLDLEINLLAEHEITRLLRITEAIARKLDIDSECLVGLDELTTDVVPRDLVDKIENTLANDA